MTAITQRIPNVLSGVSQQDDSKKLPTQLREAINCYPDVTFGMLKRNGLEFEFELKNSGTLIAPTTYNNGRWFTIFRDTNERYIGVINTTGINLWNLDTGVKQTVNIIGDADDYLLGATSRNDYHTLTINDTTFITNRTKVVAAQATPAAPTPLFKAFVMVRSLVYNSRYEVDIIGAEIDAIVDTPVDATSGTITVKDLLEDIQTQLNADGLETETIIGSGIYLADDQPSWGVVAFGGATGDALEVFKDSINNFSRLPSACKHGYVVKVVNSGETEDDYWVKFVGNSNVDGAGVWEETVSPSVSPGLNATTMPHKLTRVSADTWELSAIDWEDRLVGDDLTNPMPSFVGKKIQSTFFYRNRFGVLSDDNIIMSQTGDYYNFFIQSALTSVESDPIDVTVGTTKPTRLTAVMPVTQGLLLFGDGGDQILMSSDEAALTSESILFQTLSQYQYDPINDPVSMGSTVAFLSKGNFFTRVFEMETLGNNQNPYVQDNTRNVKEYIPNTIDQVVGSPQNSLLSLASTSSRTMYLFSFFQDGERRQNQAWFKWIFPGEVLHHAVFDDTMWVVLKLSTGYAVGSLELVQSPTTAALMTQEGLKSDPKLDLWAKSTTVTYIEEEARTRILLPNQATVTGADMCLVVGNATEGVVDIVNAGSVYTPDSIGVVSSQRYAYVNGVNLEDENIYVGYKYQYQLDLPYLYYRSGDAMEITDTRASVTISRVKFDMGLTGDVSFVISAKGLADATLYKSVREQGTYNSNDIPYVDNIQFTVPVYQRPENFNISIQSDSPFPVSLLSMQWEGQYSRKFYRRA